MKECARIIVFDFICMGGGSVQPVVRHSASSWAPRGEGRRPPSGREVMSASSGSGKGTRERDEGALDAGGEESEARGKSGRSGRRVEGGEE